MVFAVLSAGLWLWLAARMFGGGTGARIVAIVLACLEIPVGQLRFATPQSASVRVLDVVALVLTVGTVILLARPAARTFFVGDRPYRDVPRRTPWPPDPPYRSRSEPRESDRQAMGRCLRRHIVRITGPVRPRPAEDHGER